jgi:HD-like signal output (HDOD) protein
LHLTPPPLAAELPTSRTQVLERVLGSPRLPTPPVVAMKIVQATANPNTTSAEIGDLIRQDPALCAAVLKAINSCVYGLSSPVSSVERAVLLLGLNAVRSVVLTLSLPAMQFAGVPDQAFRDHWLASVSGAVIARELAVRLRRPLAEEDLTCGLLRDIGSLALRQAFPEAGDQLAAWMEGKPFSALSECEREVYGVDHAEVSAELLRRWRLPDGICEPIRYHHEPHRMTDVPPEVRERADLLAFVEALTHLDVVAHFPEDVDALLKTAADKYALSQTELIEFLQGVMPKIEAFTQMLTVDVGRCPDYAATLADGCGALVTLAVQSGTVAATAVVRTPVPPPADLAVGLPADPNRTVAAGARLPEFLPGFLDDFPACGCRLDDYILTKVLGRGSMGVVFKGLDPELDRVVAIKMMDADMTADPQGKQRFLREARNAAAVCHENVVNIFAVKDTGRHVFLVMECVDGETLEDLMDRDHPLPVARLRDLAGQIAAGLVAAHDRTIIHRDVKPGNVLLVRETGRAKLTDFGLARSEKDVAITEAGSVIGTPLYMSPEQANGLLLDPRSDLFSLGSVLYHAATGKPPFDSHSIMQVLRMVCEKEPVPPSQIRPDLPAWFDRIVLKLMAKNPDDRFQTAQELVEALRTADTPPPTPPPPKGRGWRRFFGG